MLEKWGIFRRCHWSYILVHENIFFVFILRGAWFMYIDPLLKTVVFTVYRFNGLVAVCHSFCIFFFFLQYLHSYNHSFISFAEAHLHIFTAAGSVGGTSKGCREEIRTPACLTASLCTTIWATLHPRRVIYTITSLVHIRRNNHSGIHSFPHSVSWSTHGQIMII